MEGSAMDALRLAFMRRGFGDGAIGPGIRSFLTGFRRHILRADVVQQFPELQVRVPTLEFIATDPAVYDTRNEQRQSLVNQLHQTPSSHHLQEQCLHDEREESDPQEVSRSNLPTSAPVVASDEHANPQVMSTSNLPTSAPVVVVISVDEHENEEDSEEDDEENAQQHPYDRVVRWIYNDDREMEAELQRQNSIVPVSNLTVEDRVKAQRLERNRRARDRAAARSTALGYINLC